MNRLGAGTRYRIKVDGEWITAKFYRRARGNGSFFSEKTGFNIHHSHIQEIDENPIDIKKFKLSKDYHEDDTRI